MAIHQPFLSFLSYLFYLIFFSSTILLKQNGSNLNISCSTMLVFLHFQVNQRSDPILAAFKHSLLHGQSLLTEILFVKQNKNRAWFQVIPCGLDIEKHANIFSSADLLLLLDNDQTLSTPHMQMQTCQVSWLCRESHDFTTYLTLAQVGNWFATPRNFWSCRVLFQVRYR